MKATVSLTDDSGVTTSLSVSKDPALLRYLGKADVDLFDENEKELSAFSESIEVIAKHLVKAHTSITFSLMMTYIADASREIRKKEASEESQDENKPSESNADSTVGDVGNDANDDIDCP